MITGAGVSADSGIPTYRGEEGYWRQRSPFDLATAAAFSQNPQLVWEWYGHRRAVIRASEPNPAHHALASLARQTDDALIVTQNVDDLHERAGTPAARLVHVHGDIFVNRCTACGYRDERDVQVSPPPRCPRCSGALRPGVVWFDEELDEAEVGRIETFLARGPCELVLVVGTTAVFDYIVDWARRAAGTRGRLIEVNPESTNLTPYVTRAVREPAARAVPRLLAPILRETPAAAG